MRNITIAKLNIICVDISLILNSWHICSCSDFSYMHACILSKYIDDLFAFQGGGGCLFIYSCSARRIKFLLSLS